MGECKAGQTQFHPLGFIECDAHVLDEMIDEEAWIEVASEDARRQVGERPAGCRAAADGLQHSVQVSSRLVAVEKTLADAHHRASDGDLVAELRVLTGTRTTVVHDLLAHCLEQRHEGLEDLFIASGHDRQCCHTGPTSPPGDRSVYCMNTLALAAAEISCSSRGSVVVISIKMLPGLVPAKSPFSLK